MKEWPVLLAGDERAGLDELGRLFDQGQEFWPITASDPETARQQSMDHHPAAGVFFCTDQDQVKIWQGLFQNFFAGVYIVPDPPDSDTSGLFPAIYLPPPIRLDQLGQVLRSAIDQAKTHYIENKQIGPYQLCGKVLKAIKPADSVQLTDTELGIISYLLLANGKKVLREDILRGVWGYGGTVSTHTLETHIYRLRRKISATPTAIQQDDGGYRLNMRSI